MRGDIYNNEVQEINFIIPIFTVGIAAEIATFTLTSLGIAGTSSEVLANQRNSFSFCGLLQVLCGL
jgi:hypothetical protein